jgi:hypothetical protein
MKTRFKGKSKRARSALDAPLREFKKRDPGGDIRRAGSARVVRRTAKPTSIVLDEELVALLREKGAWRGLGYQTTLKLRVREHLEEY